MEDVLCTERTIFPGSSTLKVSFNIGSSMVDSFLSFCTITVYRSTKLGTNSALYVTSQPRTRSSQTRMHFCTALHPESIQQLIVLVDQKDSTAYLVNQYLNILLHRGLDSEVCSSISNGEITVILLAQASILNWNLLGHNVSIKE